MSLRTTLKTLALSSLCKRGYDDYAKERDAEIAEFMCFHSLNDCYVPEPHEVLKKDGIASCFHPLLSYLKTLYTQFYALEYTRGKQAFIRLQRTLAFGITR